MTPSEALRRGIKLLADAELKPPPRGLIGAGMFGSGFSALATNPKHMEGFGKKWRNGKWDW